MNRLFQLGAMLRLGLLLGLAGLTGCVPAKADLTVFLEEP
jgi:hypothetical protein